jgi:hypothetical protein
MLPAKFVGVVPITAHLQKYYKLRKPKKTLFAMVVRVETEAWRKSISKGDAIFWCKLFKNIWLHDKRLFLRRIYGPPCIDVNFHIRIHHIPSSVHIRPERFQLILHSQS